MYDSFFSPIRRRLTGLKRHQRFFAAQPPIFQRLKPVLPAVQTPEACHAGRTREPHGGLPCEGS